MKKMVSHGKAFTIMEMIVVIVIISFIAAFGIASYTRSVTKNQERNMILNLLTMRAAVEIWSAKNNNTFPSGADWGDLNTINANLGINIMDQDATYSCTWTAAAGDKGCEGTNPAGWMIHFHLAHSGGQLHCYGGVCPTCPNNPGNCD